MQRAHIRLLTIALLWGAGTFLGPEGGTTGQAAGRAATPTVEALAAHFVRAIHRNDLQQALTLVPTRAQLLKAGLTRYATEKGYAAFLAKRRRGFAKVVAKHRRKHPEGCKRLTFSRVKKGELRRRGALSIYSSIDVFANCDGREIWIGDPDGIFRTAAGWRLLEFS